MIKYSYEIVQIGTERFNGVNDVVKEIRFYHVGLEEADLIKLFYVVHIDYDKNEKEIYQKLPLYKKIYFRVINYLLSLVSDKKITKTKLLLKKQAESNKDIVAKYIEISLGKDQIKHMENIMKIEMQQTSRRYINIFNEQ
jgi:hypothetical protein